MRERFCSVVVRDLTADGRPDKPVSGDQYDVHAFRDGEVKTCALSAERPISSHSKTAEARSQAHQTVAVSPIDLGREWAVANACADEAEPVDDTLGAYLREVGRFDLLTAGQERVLARRMEAVNHLGQLEHDLGMNLGR